MGKISEQFVANLLASIDIVKIISAKQVNLRKQGAHYTGLCPFHNEKTPSFSVNPVKQFYYCFGCGQGGNAINFIMKSEGKSFMEAVEQLASSVGMQVSKAVENPQVIRVHTQLERVAKLYAQQLLEHKQAKHALHYLRNRGMGLKIVKEFQLGYALPGWQHLVEKDNQELQSDLLQAGLIVVKEQNCYDRFRNRLMFPIRNRIGKVIGFGARALVETDNPKYLNSPETIVFNKGHELYGIYEAKQRLGKLTSLLVVEGYTDVLSLNQAGISGVVATLGTALTEHHIKYLFQVTSEVVFCFDGDQAGDKAADKAMALVFKTFVKDKVVKFLLLPKGFDPDQFVQEKGAQEFTRLIKQAQPLADFMFDMLQKKYPGKEVFEMTKFADHAKSYINLLPNGTFKQMLYAQLSQLVGIDSFTLAGKKQTFSKSNKVIGAKGPRITPVTPAIRALAILLHNRELINCIDLNQFKILFDNGKLSCDDDDLALLYRVATVIFQDQAASISTIQQHLSTIEATKLDSINIAKIVQSVPSVGVEQEFIGAVKQSKRVALDNMLEKLLKKAKQGGLQDAEKQLLQQLLIKTAITS